jgi:hypothetical protein
LRKDVTRLRGFPLVALPCLGQPLSLSFSRVPLCERRPIRALGQPRETVTFPIKIQPPRRRNEWDWLRDHQGLASRRSSRPPRSSPSANCAPRPPPPAALPPIFIFTSPWNNHLSKMTNTRDPHEAWEIQDSATLILLVLSSNESTYVISLRGFSADSHESNF